MKLTKDNHKHLFILNSDLKDECRYCGLLRTTVESKPVEDTKGNHTLCLDDWFPKCDGTRTHPLTVKEIVEIPEIKEYISSQKNKTLETVRRMIEDNYPDNIERAVLLGLIRSIKD